MNKRQWAVTACGSVVSALISSFAAVWEGAPHYWTPLVIGLLCGAATLPFMEKR